MKFRNLIIPTRKNSNLNLFIMKRSLQFFGKLLLYLVVLNVGQSLSAQIITTLLDPLSQTKFINPLPRPAVLQPTVPGGNNYSVSITQFKQHLGLFDPSGGPLMTTVWGYNGSYPGPTIEALKDNPVSVTWNNDLTDSDNYPLDHLFPVDESLINYDLSSGIPTVTHLHGGHTEAASDGHPRAWFTPGFGKTGDTFVKQMYYYENDQEAATLWYHDHAMGITRLNVYAGLAGFYLLRDSWENSLNLPSGDFEVPLAIQDRSFFSDGSLYYPSNPYPVEQGGGILPEMFGDFILVNGAVWPYLDVEPRKYRLRLLNGSDSRFYDLFLPGVDFYQIGSDGGLLNSPVMTNRIPMGPGERIDVIVDFSAVAGQNLILKNNARSPFPYGETPNPRTTGQIMAFRVAQTLTEPDTSELPANLRPYPITDMGNSSETRQLILSEGVDEYGRMKPMLGTVADGPLEFMEEITENPALNAIEEWEIYNTTPDAHPVHLHLVHFQVLSTQKFNVKKFIPGNPESIQLLGQPRKPSAVDAGLKDTFVILPGEVARVKALFDKEGLYVWHCHILSHEDYDMMRPFYVGEMPELIAEHEKTMNTESLSLEAEILTSLQIAPNPFKESTQINFSFKENAVVIVRIYDFLGREVAAPFSGAVKANQNYEVQFDRKGLPGSTYICRLITSDGRSYEKLILAN